LLQEIDSVKTELDSSIRLDACEERRSLEHFMLDFTYNSNAIEGSTLTMSETALVILEGLTINKKPLRDHFDAVNHKHAFDYIIALSKDKEVLTEKVIKEIHSLVFAAEPFHKGKYRDAFVQIFGALVLSSYASDTRHPIEKIADFHINFERIHPFIDSNDRAGRLIMNLQLIQAGYLPINVKFTDRQAYIGCFNDYSENGHSGKFIEMAARYELEELQKHLAAIQMKEECLKKYRQNK